MSGRTAWDEGYEAAKSGMSESDNPYNSKLESRLYSGWRSGWCDWMYQNPEDNYCGGY